MVIRRDERITRMAAASINVGWRLKTGDDAPRLVETIRLDAIDPDPDQPRRHFDPGRLQELAESLLVVGQLQPIIVIRTGDRFRIQVGERRWRASTLAGLTTIRALVRATPPEACTARIAQIVENEQRDDLTVSELILAVRDLQRGGLKNVEIASALSRSPGRISELVALGEAPEPLVAMIDALGLDLSYQLFRQWRAEPQATLDFLAHMPVEHISRVTIATIGQVPTEPASAEPDRNPVAASRGGRSGLGEGASRKGQNPAARAPATEAPRPSADDVDAPALSGRLIVEHSDHGQGHVVFGRETPLDHLAVRFGDDAPIIIHKDALRLLRTVAASADHVG